MIYIKRKRIFLIIILVILILLSALAIWQRDNIKAFYMGLTETEESLSEKRKENDKIITETLDKYPEISVRDLTDEEKKALSEGKITNEEVLLLLQGKTTLEALLSSKATEETPSTEETVTPPSEEPPPEEPPTEEPVVVTPPEADVTEPPIAPPEEEPTVSPPPVEETTESNDEKIASLVAEMYILKAEFTSALKNLENTTLKDYAALPTEEKTAEVKANMMTKVLDEVAVMEKTCDTKVEAILTSLTTLLTEGGKDLSLVDSIRTAYKNEKTITKAEYINTYFK